MNSPLRTYCEIDLSAIRHNLQLIRKKIGPRRTIAAVIKADAYGHGSQQVAQFLQKESKLIFAVATPDEAVKLRNYIPHKQILVMSCLRPNEVSSVIESKFTPSISHLDTAKKLDAAAKKNKIKIPIHIEVDTGIGRIGPYYKEAAAFIKKISSFKNLQIEGMFTHFASSDEPTHFTNLQLQRFHYVLDELNALKINIPIKHTANSAAVISHPKSYFEMVRPGLMLYGLYPNNSMKQQITLKQAMTLKAEIVHLRKVNAGYSVSYGRTYITTMPTTIATINVGYRNGYSRLGSNKGFALLHGKRVPIIGRICMDQLMLDVTSIPKVNLGDTVVCTGTQGKQSILLDEIADWSSTINYESACTIGSMTKRIYPGE